MSSGSRGGGGGDGPLRPRFDSNDEQGHAISLLRRDTSVGAESCDFSDGGTFHYGQWVIGPDGMRLKLTQPNQRGDVAALEWEQQGFVSFDPADVVLLRD